MSRQKPQAETPEKHPETYQRDLNPNAMAGQNIGVGEYQTAKNARTAYNNKQAHQRLSNLTDDNLRQIRVLPQGARLEQGATYIDLNDLEKGEFTATGDMRASADDSFIAKKEVPYHLWNVLTGVDTEERIPDSSDIGAVNPKTDR
jgi:hypothetical protein